MPISQHYDKDAKVLFVEFEGTVSDDEFEAYAREQAGQDLYPVDANELLDLRNLRSAFKSETLKKVASHYNAHESDSSNVRVAVVTGSNLGFGLSRQYQNLRESQSPVSIRVFRDIEEAREWLGLAP